MTIKGLFIMLCEIFCKQFHQQKITFHNNLNVVLGTTKADNSIGKSTLLLIIDYVFGGDKYSDSIDILDNIGEHTIGFKFRFKDKEYYFSRAFLDRSSVSTCDANYQVTGTLRISEFKEWLSEQYGLTLFDLSFRDAVSRYIRVYGKGNYDEKHPLHAISTEPAKNATISLLKLFDGYKEISKLEEMEKESSDKLKAFRQAQKHNFISTITKTKFNQNIKDISRIRCEIDSLAKDLNYGLMDLNSISSTKAIEIKKQLSHARRLRSKLVSRMSTIEENGSYKFSLTSEVIQELALFFPQTNFRRIAEIESFHKEIAKIFRQELTNERKKLNQELKSFDEEILKLNNQLMELIPNSNLSNKILQRYAELNQQVEQMGNENWTYRESEDLRSIQSQNQQMLETAKSRQFALIEKKINREMDRINDLLYKEKHNSPIIHFENSGYTFQTPNDTGTGIAYKGLIVFDLAILSLTSLPILVHDSLLLKQISDDAVENILDQYASYNKQVFIAFDKQKSYSSKVAATLDENTVITLAPGGEELFGRSWSKRSA